MKKQENVKNITESKANAIAKTITKNLDKGNVTTSRPSFLTELELSHVETPILKVYLSTLDNALETFNRLFAKKSMESILAEPVEGVEIDETAIADINRERLENAKNAIAKAIESVNIEYKKLQIAKMKELPMKAYLSAPFYKKITVKGGNVKNDDGTISKVARGVSTFPILPKEILDDEHAFFSTVEKFHGQVISAIAKSECKLDFGNRTETVSVATLKKAGTACITALLPDCKMEMTSKTVAEMKLSALNRSTRASMEWKCTKKDIFAWFTVDSIGAFLHNAKMKGTIK